MSGTTNRQGLKVTSAANLLGLEVSPYLLQHEGNLVHWRLGGAAALAEARRLNRPVLLSIGYAGCRWYDIMAHETFETRTRLSW